MQTAIVVTHGEDQSIQLPRGCRVQATELLVKQVGKSLVLIPKGVDAWDLLQESLGQFSDDFMKARAHPDQQAREVFFE